MRAGRLWAALAPVVLLSGCAGPATALLPYAREIEQTALMEALAVDLAPEGVAVTASSSARAGTEGASGGEPLVLQSAAETVAAACGRMQTYGADNVFFGDVEHVLLGEELAEEGLWDLLGHMARDPELRLEAELWVVEGEAAGALFDAAGDGGAPARLSALEDDARLLGAPAPKTAREALAELLQDGCTLLPLLAREEVREGQGLQGEGTASQSGYALFRGGRLAGMAREKEAHGMDLLLDRGEGRLLALSAPDGRETSLRLAQVRTAVRPVFQEGALTGLSVTCRIQAEVAELRGGGMDEALRSWLEAQAAREAGESIAAALALCQRLECDCLHLGPRAALAVPWEKEALKEQWPAAFAGLELQLDVQAAVARM